MRLAGYQPQYFPRLHYFNRVLSSDMFAIGDYLQYVRKHAYILPDGTRKRGNSYQAHSPIKHSQGEFLLSVPAKGKFLAINQTEIDYSKKWVTKHIQNIAMDYMKASYFPEFFDEIEMLLKHKYTNLADLNIRTILWGISRLITDDEIPVTDLTIEYVNELLGTDHPFRLKRIFLDSEFVPKLGKGMANEWIISLCRYAGADEYMYGGSGHNSYMNLKLFEKAGIKPVLQNWHCLPYRQQYYKVGFLPNLSIIDLVMNEELEVRRKVILG